MKKTYPGVHLGLTTVVLNSLLRGSVPTPSLKSKVSNNTAQITKTYILILFTAITAANCFAQTNLYFTDSFDGATFVPQLQVTPSTYFITNGEAGAIGRHYVKTVHADYLHVDFVADLTYVQTTDGAVHGAGGVFFGLGPAKLNSSFFNEPYPAIFLLDLASNFTVNGGWLNIRKWETYGNSIRTQDNLFSTSPDRFSGKAKARIIKQKDLVTFQADLRFDGSNFFPQLSQSYSLSANALFLNSTNSNIFFGTADPTAGSSIASPTRFLEFTVEHLPPALNIRRNEMAEVELWWSSQSNKVYQIQQRSALDTNQWTNLGFSIVGTGSNNRITNAVDGHQRFYRVLELP